MTKHVREKIFFFDLIGEDGSNPSSIYSDHIRGRILGIKETLKCYIYDECNRFGGPSNAIM